jgi:hypothetical protein
MMEINETVDRLTKWIIIWDASFSIYQTIWQKAFSNSAIEKSIL